MRILHVNNFFQVTFIIILACLTGCTSTGTKKSNQMKNVNKIYEKGTYGYDVAFFAENNIETIELQDAESGSSVLIVPAYQGRVMTSSADGNEGNSFGWINYGFISAGKASSQFNPFGGEERLWLGPEGGPWSIYFKPGVEQVFAN